MAEMCGVGTCPQVFVVDTQANYVTVPTEKKPWWARASQKCLLPLLGLTVFGLVVQGCLIYNLYNRLEAFSLRLSHPPCQNLSNPKSSGQQGGIILGRVGTKESNEIPTVRPHPEQVQLRPFAQLIGPKLPLAGNNVVQWVNNGPVAKNMSYNNGRLIVERAGFYYLYSKVTLTELACSQHKVMRDTKAYDIPIVLMKSKSSCRTWRSPSEADMWNNFLAGVFQLQEGDKVYVTLESEQKMHSEPTDLLGAFMIYP